ncbi:MAG: hypothetical protein ABIH41_04665 [Nanoarchaeota archaeon]
MVSQVLVLLLQSLEVLVFSDGLSECGFADLVGEDAEFLFGLDFATFPFFGQFLSYGYASKSLVDPVLRVSFQFVVFLYPVLSELWVLDLFDALIADLGKPLLEWFGLLGWDGLDDSEQRSGVCAVCGVRFAIG